MTISVTTIATMLNVIMLSVVMLNVVVLSVVMLSDVAPFESAGPTKVASKCQAHLKILAGYKY